MRCAITLICSAAALQPSVTRVEVNLRPSTPSQQQPLWDSPLSANDALTQTIPMLSSAPIETEAGERFRVDVYPRGNTGKRAAAVYLRYLSRGNGDDVHFMTSLYEFPFRIYGRQSKSCTIFLRNFQLFQSRNRSYSHHTSVTHALY